MDHSLQVIEEVYQESLDCEAAASFIAVVSQVLMDHKDVLEKNSPGSSDILLKSNDVVTSLQQVAKNLLTLLRMLDIVNAYVAKYGKDCYDELMSVPINFDVARDYTLQPME